MTQLTPSPESLAKDALDAFWQVICHQYPDSKSGDLSIDRTLCLKNAAETAIKEWIANNVTL